MSSHVTNNPFLDAMVNGNSQKANGKSDPFANNQAITKNEFFNPLENENYSEIMSQTGKSMFPKSEAIPQAMSLSDVLNTAKSELLNNRN